MRPVNEQLAMDLLEAGKKEFLAYGFQGTSMRRIASSIGVTTGAIYRYYTDKESIFEAIVDKKATELVERYRSAQQEYAALPLEQQIAGLSEISDNNMWIMEFVYDNFDVFKLIACASSGTRYEHYIDTLVEIEANSGAQLVEMMIAAGYKVRPMDDGLIHIISSGLFNCMFETVRHDMPRKKAFDYLNSYRLFYTAGWLEILGLR